MLRTVSHSTSFAIVGFLLTLAGCEAERSSDSATPANAAPSVTQSRPIMGTLASLTAVAADKETAAAAVEAGYARLEDVNRLMSDYIEDSEIGRLNRLPAGEVVTLSPETLFCMQQALAVGQASGGAFEITCRPLVWLWKGCGKEGRLPTDDELAAAQALVGADKVVLDTEHSIAKRTHAGVQVDLGGIAKGYALDLAAEAMLKAGAASALVDVGGDVLAVGMNAEGTPWRIGVRDPFGGMTTTFAALALSDRAVATSGNQERFYEIDGHRYSHIIDPRTGRPAEQAPAVTVIAANGLTADAWATVFSVLSIAEGQQLIAAGKTPKVEVMWITGPAESPTIEKTPGFDNYAIN